MPIQSRITDIKGGFKKVRDRLRNYAEKPSDDELDQLIAPTEFYPFDVDNLDHIDELRQDIRDARFATDPIEAWSFIVGDHVKYTNSKLADTVAVFNMGAATDCINLGTEYCQVDAGECYAVQSEQDFPCLDFRRRQQILWDHIDGVTWAKAFRRHYKRKDNPVDDLRISESGDFRTQHDIHRINEIAKHLNDIVTVYTYSASSWLDWSAATHFTVNQSNNKGDFGDRNYSVVEDPESMPDDAGIWCPYDQTDGNIKCGECRVCLEPDGPDVYIELEETASGPETPNEDESST